jgi:glucose/arabinose dehydrogenase
MFLACRIFFLLSLVGVALSIATCSGSDNGGGGASSPPSSPPSFPPAPAPSTSLRLQPLSSVLAAPVFLTVPPGDVGRLFVVEQGGLIKSLNSIDGTPRATFLDVSALITSGGERGLLGMAFDPGFGPPTNNGRFYIYYTDLNGDIIIARYLVNSSNAELADPSSAFILKTIPHPTNANHNGGMLAFGPDGCLYAGIGDGGGAGDVPNNAQTTTTLLGKILRLDPNAGNACTLMTNNPFASGGGAPEVWSVGLRNPWRFSFDRTTGDLYIGDVGEAQREEVDVMLAPSAGRGINFGWHIMEGLLCFDPPNGCNTSGLSLPVLDYTHDAGACAIIGGYVYRGSAIPNLQGTYFYGDLCARFVRSFRYVNGKVTENFDWASLHPAGSITSFGEDNDGELYILGGALYRIVQM